MKIQVLLGKGEENSKGREGTGKCRAGRDTNIKKDILTRTGYLWTVEHARYKNTIIK